MTSRDRADPESAAPHRMPRAVARRLHLITVARGVFAQTGYFAASMEEIALRAGVSKPVLYQNFSNKHELYLAVLDTVHHDLVAMVRTAVAERRDRSAVAAVVHSCCTALAEGGPAELLVTSDLRYEPAVRRVIDAVWRSVTGAVLGAIDGIRTMSRAELDVLGAIVAGTLGSAARLWADGEPALDRASVERLMTDVIWKGIEGLDGKSEPAATDGRIPVSVYLESGAGADTVEAAVRDLLDANVIIVAEAGKPVLDSWFRLLLGRTSAEPDEAMSRLAREIRSPTLITALGRQRNACVQIGSVALLKVDGAVRIATVSR